MTLLAGIPLFALLWFLTASNYWAFFVTMLIGYLLFVAWSFGFVVYSTLFVLRQLKRIRTEGYDPKHDERIVAFTIPAALVCLLSVGFSFLILLQGFPTTVYELSHGPIYGRGIVEKEIVFTRGGPALYIIVQDTRYFVPDPRWFQTLTTDQEIEFLYSPKTHQAFPFQTD